MAELTRHRLASFTIESTRFNAYKELTFIRPNFFDYRQYDVWFWAMDTAESNYKKSREKGSPPEQARTILPNSLKTEIIMTANLREWRHVLKLRTAKDAHPQMRQVANMILDILKQKLPVIFEDIGA